MIYAYCRISKDHERSMSVADQAHKIRCYADALDIRINTSYEDRDASGASFERPEMTKLLARLQPGDTVIVYRLDRLTRSVRDLGDFFSRGITLISVTEHLDTSSASGRLVVNILGAVASWERETIVERTTASLAARRAAGRRYGSVPYGWKDVDGKLARVESEQSALDALRDYRARGLTMAECARQLSVRHPDAARGARWYPATVRSILNSAMFEGAVA